MVSLGQKYCTAFWVTLKQQEN